MGDIKKARINKIQNHKHTSSDEDIKKIATLSVQ